jgi:hypothetical protein
MALVDAGFRARSSGSRTGLCAERHALECLLHDAPRGLPGLLGEAPAGRMEHRVSANRPRSQQRPPILAQNRRSVSGRAGLCPSTSADAGPAASSSRRPLPRCGQRHRSASVKRSSAPALVGSTGSHRHPPPGADANTRSTLARARTSLADTLQNVWRYVRSTSLVPRSTAADDFLGRLLSHPCSGLDPVCECVGLHGRSPARERAAAGDVRRQSPAIGELSTPFQPKACPEVSGPSAGHRSTDWAAEWLQRLHQSRIRGRLGGGGGGGA